MAEEYGEYLHLHLDNAKINIATNFNKLNLVQDMNFGKHVRQQYNKAWGKLPEYMRKRDSEFESWVAKAMNYTSYSTGQSGAASISTGLASLGGQVGSFHLGALKQDSQKLKQAVNDLNSILDLIDKADQDLNLRIADLALENPMIRQMLNISFPDGLYQVSTDTNRINERIKNALTTAKTKANQISASLGQPGSEDELGSIIRAIESIISSSRGFLYEVEVLEGFLKSIQEGNQAVAYTGKVKGLILDPKLEQDRSKAAELQKELAQIMANTTVAQPKADITCALHNGSVAIFGVSIKSISKSKADAINKGLKGKSHALSLGSSYKTLAQVIDAHENQISSVIGGYKPKWYGAQILTGWEDPEASPYAVQHNESNNGQLTAAWNQVMNLCAILVLSDALVGDMNQIISGGVATYLVVNNQVYWAKDVLNKVALALEHETNPGVYAEVPTSINRAWGLALQERSRRTMRGPGETVRQLALERSNAIWREWDSVLASQIIKVKISLGALINIGGKAGLTPVI